MACLSDGSLSEGDEKFHHHSDRKVYAVFKREKLAVPNLFENECRKTNLIRVDGDAGYYVS